MKIKNRFNPALLAILAALMVAITLISGKAEAGANVAQASSNSQPSVANSPLNARAQAPAANWRDPVSILIASGYDANGYIAASPINGAITFMWGMAPDDQTGWVAESSNTTLNGAFNPEVIDEASVALNGVMSATHDNLGRRHLLYWSWTGSALCDHYAMVGTNGQVIINESIPGSCENGIPRKLGGIDVDANNNVHIVLARNNQTGTMLYWQRSAAGAWVVQREYVAQNCCPSDVAVAVSTQGTVMTAFKSGGIYGSGSDIYTVTRNSNGSWNLADDISAQCCVGCPTTSGAYLPKLAADRNGGIRAVWADGRCYAGGPTDIYYREWVPGTGWNDQPLVQVVNNSGSSYYPDIAVDDGGEAHLIFADDTSSPFNYYRIFYAHGRGTSFSGVDIPFQNWAGNAWQRDPSIDYGANYIHVAFASIKYDPNKDNFYSNLAVTIPPTATPTRTSTPTRTPTKTRTPTPTYTATPIPAPCNDRHFHDVCLGDTFYTEITSLNEAGIISGYSSSPPCPNSGWIPCFLPGNNASRAQMSKVVVLSADLPINTTGFPHFQDVTASDVFSSYIETAFNNGLAGGYVCGGPGEPCNPPYNLPYFRPANTITRGQLTKMATLAFGYNGTVVGQTFEDVPPGSTFYNYVQQAADLGLVTGYACGGIGEPCGIGNRPYFRPNTAVTRGQGVKILYGFRQLPPPTATPTHTSTTVPAIPTYTSTPEELTATPTGTAQARN